MPAEGCGGASSGCYYSSHVANPTMVPEFDSNASLRSITFTKKCTQPSVQQCNVSQITQGLVPSCLSNIRTYFRSKGLSERSVNILCHSWRSSTVKQYQIYCKKCLSFCGVRKENPMLYNETLVIEFLTRLFHEGAKYSAINSARSALSTFLINEYGITIENSSLVKRFFKGIFELNPPVARYCMVWDVNIVLSNFYPLDDLPLSILTYKLTMLLALATHQRVQTLKAISVVDIKVFRDSVFIPIKQLLKHSTQQNYKQAFYLHAFPDPAICVIATLKHYLDRTSLLRGTHSQLISFHKPHYPSLDG